MPLTLPHADISLTLLFWPRRTTFVLCVYVWRGGEPCCELTTGPRLISPFFLQCPLDLQPLLCRASPFLLVPQPEQPVSGVQIKRCVKGSERRIPSPQPGTDHSLSKSQAWRHLGQLWLRALPQPPRFLWGTITPISSCHALVANGRVPHSSFVPFAGSCRKRQGEDFFPI